MLFDTTITDQHPGPTGDTTADGPSPNVAKWIAALRSGRYAQTSRLLRNSEGFCCLGVACDISGLGKWIPMDEFGDLMEYEVDGESHGGYLPEPVWRWLGLKDGAGTHGDGGRDLAFLNDKGDYTFAEIASIIESIDTNGRWTTRLTMGD